MNLKIILFCLPILGAGCASMSSLQAQASNNKTSETKVQKEVKQVEKFAVQMSEEEWKKKLSPEQYQVLREKGTERPFTGKYWNFNEKGEYLCAACGEALFESDTKFDAGCGWPSFYEAVGEGSVVLKEDRTHGMVRTEVLCGKCGGHLGHVFDDGPKPTGKRFCINSASIEFKGDNKSTPSKDDQAKASSK